MLNGEYGESDVYAGVPSVVNRNGVREIVELSLNEEERSKLHYSCELLRNLFNDIGL
jgi:L-lactate dehydrogenase